MTSTVFNDLKVYFTMVINQVITTTDVNTSLFYPVGICTYIDKNLKELGVKISIESGTSLEIIKKYLQDTDIIKYPFLKFWVFDKYQIDYLEDGTSWWKIPFFQYSEDGFKTVYQLLRLYNPEITTGD